MTLNYIASSTNNISKREKSKGKGSRGVGHYHKARPTLDAPGHAFNKSGNFPARNSIQID